MLKNLIIFRHGHYDSHAKYQNLTDFGCEQISQLASFIETDIPLGKTIFLSSPTPRAHQTSVIISEILGIEFKSYRELWGPARPFPTDEELTELHKIISIEADQSKAETVILSTHAEYHIEYTKFFIKKSIGKSASMFTAKGSFFWFSVKHESMIRVRVDENNELIKEECVLK